MAFSKACFPGNGSSKKSQITWLQSRKLTSPKKTQSLATKYNLLIFQIFIFLDPFPLNSSSSMVDYVAFYQYAFSFQKIVIIIGPIHCT
jgi:hypothetical protein